MLADGDPELRRAVEASLRPWRIEVVVDPTAPTDLASAEARADVSHARFVVWRDGAELVVYDRDGAALERRVAQAGAFDPLAAAAAALTVKTMMRLPPPAPDDAVPPAVTITAPPPPDRDGIELRFDGLLAARYEVGLDSTVALRFGLRAMIRPWRDEAWRFGAVGDFGAAADVEQASFHGTWSNWGVLASASYELPYDLEPWVALGIEHSSLDGKEMATSRNESNQLFAMRGGVIWRYPLGAWSIGAGVTLEGIGGTVTYLKTGSSNAIFEVPGFSAVGTLVVGTDIIP